jgi:4-amino-4-deoxy-L-arabinose transferase-like glycosyltransferase
MLAAAGLLAALAARTDVLFADGLRYIAQARHWEMGLWSEGLKSVDHPVYPLAIALAHALHGGETALDWQASAQAASVASGVLLVVPLYLVGLELFGAAVAWLTVVLFYLSPATVHVLADVLSEGTFLVFWLGGLWATLRFLRDGAFGWLLLVVPCSGLAYLTRPEGLLLPAALALTLLLIPLLRGAHLHWPRWWAAVGLMVLGPALLAGPFVLTRGGLATKPAVARLLGVAPRSPADAVERSRPLEPDVPEWKLHARGAKAVGEALAEAVTPPLLPFAAIGMASLFQSRRQRPRVVLFLGIILGAALAALVRLHVTGGYCTARHTFIVATLMTACAARGLEAVLGLSWLPKRWIGAERSRLSAGPLVWVVVLGGLAAWNAPAIATPLNRTMAGYREAARWLAEQTEPVTPIADATGWTQFYAERPGYSFATLHEAAADPSLRWVVAREAHLSGPWWYCAVFRQLIGRREPVAAFPARPQPGQSRVLVFDRTDPEREVVSWMHEAKARK